MNKFSKFSIAIYVLVFIAISLLGYIFFRSSSILNNKTDSSFISANQTINIASTDAIVDNSAVDSSTISAKSNNYLDVSKSDCTDQCKNFTDQDDLKYCQETCGTFPVEKNIKSLADCSTLKNLDKDYCLKDFAITKKDYATCQNIKDTNIQKVCQNTLTQ